SSKVLAPGGNTPRIMETTGQVSHTGTSDYPHYRGHSQGNGLAAGATRRSGSGVEEPSGPSFGDLLKEHLE
ncbi:hypothetical protein, partial [Corynebacterium freneyi]|uniref:hypothetical protein n=1 Tax=Corynebacterium freneyi TaxID=134034 RepID=UPI001EF39ACC